MPLFTFPSRPTPDTARLLAKAHPTLGAVLPLRAALRTDTASPLQPLLSHPLPLIVAYPDASPRNLSPSADLTLTRISRDGGAFTGDPQTSVGGRTYSYTDISVTASKLGSSKPADAAAIYNAARDEVLTPPHGTDPARSRPGSAADTPAHNKPIPTGTALPTTSVADCETSYYAEVYTVAGPELWTTVSAKHTADTAEALACIGLPPGTRVRIPVIVRALYQCAAYARNDHTYSRARALSLHPVAILLETTSPWNNDPLPAPPNTPAARTVAVPITLATPLDFPETLNTNPDPGHPDGRELTAEGHIDLTVPPGRLTAILPSPTDGNPLRFADLHLGRTVDDRPGTSTLAAVNLTLRITLTLRPQNLVIVQRNI